MIDRYVVLIYAVALYCVLTPRIADGLLVGAASDRSEAFNDQGRLLMKDYEEVIEIMISVRVTEVTAEDGDARYRSNSRRYYTWGFVSFRVEGLLWLGCGLRIGAVITD